jgi:hypothetical protein
MPRKKFSTDLKFRIFSRQGGVGLFEMGVQKTPAPLKNRINLFQISFSKNIG